MKDKFASSLDDILRKSPKTAAEIAAAAGIGAPYLSQLRKGGKVRPTLDVAERLADALGVPLEIFFKTTSNHQKFAETELREWKPYSAQKWFKLMTEAGEAASWDMVRGAAGRISDRPGTPPNIEDLEILIAGISFLAPPRKKASPAPPPKSDPST